MGNYLKSEPDYFLNEEETKLVVKDKKAFGREVDELKNCKNNMKNCNIKNKLKY